MAQQQFPFSGFRSLAMHAGHVPDPNYAHLVPLYASSTFVYDTAEQGMRRFSGQEDGYIYSRWGNPAMTHYDVSKDQLGAIWHHGRAYPHEHRYGKCTGYYGRPGAGTKGFIVCGLWFVVASQIRVPE